MSTSTTILGPYIFLVTNLLSITFFLDRSNIFGLTILFYSAKIMIGNKVFLVVFYLIIYLKLKHHISTFIYCYKSYSYIHHIIERSGGYEINYIKNIILILYIFNNFIKLIMTFNSRIIS